MHVTVESQGGLHYCHKQRLIIPTTHLSFKPSVQTILSQSLLFIETE